MRNLNLKHLIIAFVALLLVWLTARYLGSIRRTSNVRSDLIALDTASVDELRILRKGELKPIVLKRLDAGKWKAARENEPGYDADQSAVKQALGVFSKLSAQRMLTRKKDKWGAYDVTDSSLLVQALGKGKVMAELRVGKLSFPASGDAFTAVRLNDDDVVYAVQGYLNTNLDRDLAAWRDKTFMRLKPDRVDKVVFEYPADSSFTLVKEDTTWKAGGVAVNRDKVDRYLSQFRNKNLHAFADDFTPSGQASFIIRFEGKGAELERVEIWQRPDGSYVLRGVHLPVFFSDKGSGIIKELMKSEKYFTKG
jgi:hypothetical protein